MTLEQILARLAEVEAELRSIHETAGDAALDDPQQARFTELVTERTTLEASQVATEARMETIRSIAARPGHTESGSVDDRDPLRDERDSDPARGRGNPWDLSQIPMFGRSAESVAGDLRSRALDAIERAPAFTPRRREVLTEILERCDDDNGNLSRQVLVASDPQYLRAFGKMLRGRGHALTPAESEALSRAQEVARAMSLTDGSGGFLVPQQLDPTLILTADGTTNPIREVSRKVIATGDVWEGVTSGTASWSWDGEAGEVSDDAPTLTNPEITIHKAQGFVPFSIEVQGDALNFTQNVAMVLAEGRDDLEAAAFATGLGNGSNQPVGIITALTGGASVVASAGADTFAVGDVYNVEEALPAKYRKRAVFMADKPIYNDVRQFGVADSHALWQRIGGGQPPELLGYPAYEASEMDGTITAAADNLVLLLGDFRHYVIADRLGMVVELVQHLFGATRRPTGQRGFYAYYRVGADSVHDGAFRLLNVT